MGNDDDFELLGWDTAQMNKARRMFLMRTGLATVMSAFPAWARAQLPFNPIAPYAEAQSKVQEWTDGCGLVHNRISPYWAKQCEVLPCFKGVTWKGYAEKIRKDVPLPGTPHKVIVHLWKGHCNKFPLRSDYPGGYGAEVGIYLVRDAAWILEHANETQRNLDSYWLGAAGWYALLIASLVRLKPEEKWYPAPELKPRLKFRLLDPENNDAVILETQSAESYWCTEWLRDSSYEIWGRARPQFRRTRKPLEAVRWTLQYWINDVEQPLWRYQPGDENCVPNVGCPT